MAFFLFQLHVIWLLPGIRSSNLLVSTAHTAFSTFILSALVECAVVGTGTPDALSNCLHTACTVLTERAAHCKDLSVRLAPIDAIVHYIDLFTCSFYRSHTVKAMSGIDKVLP